MAEPTMNTMSTIPKIDFSSIVRSSFALVLFCFLWDLQGVGHGEGEGQKNSTIYQRADFPLGGRLSRIIALAFPLAVKLQRLNDGILNLLRGRPRRKVFADTLSRHFELFLLIGLFF